MADCHGGPRHLHSPLLLLAQHPRDLYSIPEREPLSTQNLPNRRFTDPLTYTHQTPPLTAPNITSSNQPFPPALIPDLTRLITRCYPYYSVSGGAYGDIYKCVYHGPDGDVEVAVKTIRPQYISDEVFRRELGIWKRLRHPNILKLMGTTRHFSLSEALVSPWIANGNLTSFLRQNDETLGLRNRLLLLRDIAAGLNHLHTFSFTVDGHTYFNPVVHGDLTGNNVLIGSDGTAYLADFGLSGTLIKLTGMTYLAKNCCPGTLRWTAPELLSEEESVAVTTQSDIYSFGSIALQVLTGKIPWPHLARDAAILRKVAEGEIHPRPDDDRVTDQHWEFMTSCWSKTPIDRPSAEEALEFVDRELVLYDQRSADFGKHPALVPVPGYMPPLIGSVVQSPPPSSPSALPSQTYSQLLHPVRSLVQYIFGSAFYSTLSNIFAIKSPAGTIQDDIR
ncbi:kinase-like domain-containing protein [Suillus lakei]|nr:kinase-like domain-containing protein [Suillus lakei]